MILIPIVIDFVRQDPKAVVVYRDISYPEPPKLSAKPKILTLYKPYRVESLKLDTIYIPVEIERYRLIESNRISQDYKGLTMTVFNPEELRYEDWYYPVIERKWRLETDFNAEYFRNQGQFSVDATLFYRNFGIGATVSTYNPVIYRATYRKVW